MSAKLRRIEDCTIERDRDLSRFIAGYFFMNSLNTVFASVIGISGTRLTVMKLLLGCCLFCLLVKPMIHFSKNEWAFVILSESAAFLLYLYSYLLGSSWSNMMNWVGDTIMVCVPMMFCAYFIRDKAILLSALLKASWIIFFLQLLIMTRNITGRFYDIHFSYTLCFLVLLHMNDAIDNKRLVSEIILIAELVMLFLYGSRGALICIACFALLKILVNTYSNNQKVIYSLLVIALLIGIIELINHGSDVYKYLSDKGVSSRTLYLLLTGQFTSHDSERRLVWASTMEAIKMQPVGGWGINGALDQLFGHAYPHQFFLEIWLSFGLVIGSALIILVVIPMKRMFSADKGSERTLLHIFFSIGFVSLMFSGTVFTSYYYFIFLGLLLNRKKSTNGDATDEV